MEKLGSVGVQREVAEVEGRCLSCDRQLEKNEIKVIPPRYVQERDSYVRQGLIARRLMCVSCYNALRPRTADRNGQHSHAKSSSKSTLLRSLINGMLAKQ